MQIYRNYVNNIFKSSKFQNVFYKEIGLDNKKMKIDRKSYKFTAINATLLATRIK